MNVNCKIIPVSVYTFSIPRITTSEGGGLIMIVVSKACMHNYKIEDTWYLYNNIITMIKTKTELIK